MRPPACRSPHERCSPGPFAEGKPRLCCHDRFTGSFRWNHIFDADGIFSPAVADGTVYVATWNPENDLWGFDVRTGITVLRDTTTAYGYQPVVANHTLFVSCSQGIRAFRNSIGVDDDAAAPSVITLQGYPNPCRDITWISIALREPAVVGISMFDLDGRAIGRGTQHPLLPGAHRLPLKMDCVAAGSYVYRVTTPLETASGRIVVLK
ncbi:MAG: PQQ-binding-like beta-propeller repeat protein [Candidatus Eisenbacteria bacterium]|nr:PQQ-binding-like beta-propeller repeat protein [Candidatus Eisenbacteria bacterium]